MQGRSGVGLTLTLSLTQAIPGPNPDPTPCHALIISLTLGGLVQILVHEFTTA